MCIFAYHFLDPAFEDQDDIPDDYDLEGGGGNDDSQGLQMDIESD